MGRLLKNYREKQMLPHTNAFSEETYTRPILRAVRPPIFVRQLRHRNHIFAQKEILDFWWRCEQFSHRNCLKSIPMLKSDRLSGSERAYYSRYLLLYFLYNILSVFTSTISDVRYRNKNTGKISGKHYSINIIGHTMLHAFCPSRDNGLSLGICQTSASAFFLFGS